MADSPDALPPDDAPLSVGDEEVERLLQEAESLTAEIADDAGVETVPPDPDSAPQLGDHDQPGGQREPRPDPLTAAARAEKAVKGLGDLLNDSDADTPPGTATPTLATPSDATPEDELASPPPPQQDADDFDGFSGLTDDDHDVFDAAATGGGTSEDHDETQTPDDRPTAAGEQTSAGDESANPERPAIWPRCAGAFKTTVSRLRKAPKAVPAGIRAVIIWTDKPFAGVSLGVKRALGAVALASILTGIAAWVLPGALAHNPFADMPSDTAVDAPAAQPTEE